MVQPEKAIFGAKALLVSGLTLFAAGCVDTVAQREPEAQLPLRTNMVQRDGVSPRGASVAIADIQGVSTPVSDQLSQVFQQEAQARDINLTGAKNANYLVRGYLSAAPAEGGSSFSLVWDVYDSKKRRTQRIDDAIFVKGAPATLETADNAVLSQIAAKSADDLAAVLSNMPEAIAAASPSGTKAVAVARAKDDGTTKVPGTLPPQSASAQSPATSRGIASASR